MDKSTNTILTLQIIHVRVSFGLAFMTLLVYGWATTALDATCCLNKDFILPVLREFDKFLNASSVYRTGAVRLPAHFAFLVITGMFRLQARFAYFSYTWHVSPTGMFRLL